MLIFGLGQMFYSFLPLDIAYCIYLSWFVITGIYYLKQIGGDYAVKGKYK